MTPSRPPHVAIIGAGFCGLAAGYDLSRRGVQVTLIDGDAEIGGLAGSFRLNGVRLEKFYHHWFVHDEHVMTLIKELGAQDHIIVRPTRTGMYYAHNLFKLSTPVDVLRFTPLPLADRVRLGLLALRVRAVKDWKTLENLTAAEWLRRMAGQRVYEVVWEPLLRGKFGDYASEVSAVWFWNKLKLRGGSRGKGGGEHLAYYRGGFAALADHVASRIRAAGGRIVVNQPVHAVLAADGKASGVQAGGETILADAIIATPALPIIADLLAPHVAPAYVDSLRRIQYLANLCVVLELRHSLSDTYWLNVNDPEFPFVGVIEHTNFASSQTYGGRHLVYLSKYLPESARLFHLDDQEVLDFLMPHLQRMFPRFTRDWILSYHVSRARYAQPVVVRNYRQLLPSPGTPLENVFIATMAQIYPEDRGTNYAIRDGRRSAALIMPTLAPIR